MFNFKRLDILWTAIRCQVKVCGHVHLLGDSMFNLGVSIYYGTQTDIRVKHCASLNFLGDSMFNFESLNMLWPAIGYQSQNLWPFKFSWSIRVQFRDSWYILGVNRTFDSKVMAFCICEEILRSIPSVSICYGPQSDVWVKTYRNLNLPKASVSNFKRRGICWDPI